jgi:hypothetical protein
MERCVRDGPTAVNWAAAAKRDEMAVLTAAKTLGGAAARSDCAIPAFRALLDGGGDYRWGAFLGVQAQLAARGQRPEAAAVFKMPGMQGLPTHQVHLLLAAAGHGFEREAAIMADTAAVDYARMSNITLWHLASWEARANNSRRLRDIATVVRARLDSAPSRTNRLLNAAVDARVLVALGDSVGAIRLLRGLTPTGTRRDILWQPWESLGPERLLLAELLMRRGEFAGSRRVAAQLDATEPVTYPLYLRRSLELRALAADAMRDARGAADYRRRLSALDRLPRR